MVIRLGERDDIDPVSSCDKKLSKETKPNLERCAAKLQAERVTITHQQGESSSAETLKGRMPVGVVFGFKKKFEKKFEPVKLEIQPLHVTETTEVQWRNYIALEHTKTTNKKFSEYALLFKGLVCCEDDIELLKTQEVLRVHDTKKWSNEKLKKFIHDIADGIQIDAKVNLEFCEMLKQLNEYKSPAGTRRILLFGHHCRRFLTNTRYTCRDLYGLLKRDHASTPWKTLGVIAAVLLLLLTVAQTVLAAIGL
ncbi:UPF0481 protein [Spatholobus suberectus]|nr:UPF0481 protein [Spatholobus suberectus]